MSLTRLLRPLFEHRWSRIQRWHDTPEATQRRVLASLLAAGARTEVGSRYHLQPSDSYEMFAERMPVVEYEDIRADVMRMVAGERDVLWPGRVHSFAQSSGTSGGASKFIPVTDDCLRNCHYSGTAAVVTYYLHNYPDSRIFDGRSFILGGSFATDLRGLAPDVRVGDLSAHLISRINPLANLVRVPSRETALLPDWSEKLPRLVEEASRANVTNISGVPSWFLVVLRQIIEYRGVDNIHQVWPNLEVFFHGGIAFAPYREQYRAIADSPGMHYMDTYNASEGFFALQSERDDTSLLLLLNNGVFYEFIPIGQLNSPDREVLPCWQLREGEVYALVITSCNGLWRYLIGDTVKVVSLNPLKIVIAGRTRSYINAFGEELMVFNADAALARVTDALGCSVANYTAAPLYADGGRRGRHQWFIEFDRPPHDLDAFALALDQALTEENSDYRAKRAGSLFLDPLVVVPIPRGTFDLWLSRNGGKLGGQRKIPRLSNDRNVADSMLELLSSAAR